MVCYFVSISNGYIAYTSTCILSLYAHAHTSIHKVHDTEQRNLTELEKPSLEVAPTTLFLIFSFSLRLLLSRRKRNYFSQFNFQFHPNKEHFPPVILNLDLWPWPTNYGHVQLPCQVGLSTSMVILLESFRPNTYTQTYTQSVASPGSGARAAQNHMKLFVARKITRN